MSWIDLPEDVLLMICEKVSVKELSQISMVCKHWHYILNTQKTLWKKVLVEYLEEEIGTASFEVKLAMKRFKALNENFDFERRVQKTKISIASNQGTSSIKSKSV